MRIFHYAPLHFEPWDFRTPDTTGIGGSETAVGETARRLAERGHEVTVYAPLADGCPEFDGKARWRHVRDADFTQPGLWILHRCPSALDEFAEEHLGQTTWLVCQDVFYPPQLSDGLTPERSAKLDRCLPLCTAHEKWLLEKSPELKGKLFLSSNGIRGDLILDICGYSCPSCRDGAAISESGCLDCGRPDSIRVMMADGNGGCYPRITRREGIVRDPYKLVFTSSPDRGLVPLLKIFKRAREWEPRLTLSAAYGFNNIDRCEGKHWKQVRAECEKWMDQPGVTWLGRMPQEQLYREFLSAGLWVYPTTFTETSCISCMEAQALGAIPITVPLWALADNVRHGVFLQGDPVNDPLCRARYVGEILRLTRDVSLQESIRSEMMPYARQRFDWERVVDQWEGWAQEDDERDRGATRSLCEMEPACCS